MDESAQFESGPTITYLADTDFLEELFSIVTKRVAASGNSQALFIKQIQDHLDSGDLVQRKTLVPTSSNKKPITHKFMTDTVFTFPRSKVDDRCGQLPRLITAPCTILVDPPFAQEKVSLDDQIRAVGRDPEAIDATKSPDHVRSQSKNSQSASCSCGGQLSPRALDSPPGNVRTGSSISPD